MAANGNGRRAGTRRPVDESARRVAVERYGFASQCLHIPVAARTEDDVATFVGPVAAVLARPRADGVNNALLVEPVPIPELDMRLPIWAMPESAVLHRPRQVWVHVDFSGYRKAYGKAFPAERLDGIVLDHVLNRRQARLHGFFFLRVVPICRSANSSSGGLSERWGVEHSGTVAGTSRDWHRTARIRHADIADIAKMLDRKTGGSVQEGVQEALGWIEPRR